MVNTVMIALMMGLIDTENCNLTVFFGHINHIGNYQYSFFDDHKLHELHE